MLQATFLDAKPRAKDDWRVTLDHNLVSIAVLQLRWGEDSKPRGPWSPYSREQYRIWDVTFYEVARSHPFCTATMALKPSRTPHTMNMQQHLYISYHTDIDNHLICLMIRSPCHPGLLDLNLVRLAMRVSPPFR